MPRKRNRTANHLTRKSKAGSATLSARHEHRLTATPSAVPVDLTARKLKAVARVAAQFAREDFGLYMTVHEISALAVALVDAAYEAREAVARGKNPEQHYRGARKVVERFGGQLVENGDPLGMVVGVRFSSGRFTSAAENIFYVA